MFGRGRRRKRACIDIDNMELWPGTRQARWGKGRDEAMLHTHTERERDIETERETFGVQ